MRKFPMILAVAGLVAACGSSAASGAPQATGPQSSASQVAAGATDKPTAGAPGELDTCSLITSEEAAAVLGMPVDPGEIPEPGSSSCMWVDSAKAVNSVYITDTSGGEFDSTKKSIPGLTITRVSGIGDDAYYVDAGPGHVVLNVKKGQNSFTTSVLLKGAANDKLMADEKTLALLILGRI